MRTTEQEAAALTARAWTWANGSPRERAAFVRQHSGSRRPLNLCTLFNLTEDGLAEIIRGHDWKPEYEAYHDGSSQPTKD